jgi:hypothetical protein
MNANRTGRDDTELAFRAFQVDRNWYDSYWEEEPRWARAGFVRLLVFMGMLTAELARRVGRWRTTRRPRTPDAIYESTS